MRLTRDKIQEAYDAYLRDTPAIIAVDTETTGFSWYDTAFCMTVAWEGESHYLELAFPEARRVAMDMLRTKKLVFHNAKFDLQKLIYGGLIKRDALHGEKIEDTECMAHLLNPHAEKKLKVLAREILGLSTDESEAVRKAKAQVQRAYKKRTGQTLYAKDVGYDMLPRRAVYPYAIKDAEFTWLLYKALKPKITGTLAPLYEREMELTLVLLDIEAAGMQVDMRYVDEKIKELNGKILSCELRIADQSGLKVWYPEKPSQKTPEGCFNPNSTVQMMEVFGAHGIDLPDTKRVTLESTEHELAQTIVELRKAQKLRGTYLLSIKNDSRDGIMHPSYKQHEPKTGRMSSAAQSGD